MKQSSIVSELITERKRILAEIEKSPLHAKLKAIESLLSSYSGHSATNHATKKDRIHDLAKACIVDHGGFAKKPVIFDYIRQHGVSTTLGTLSFYLHNYPDLKSDRRKGWSLR